MKNIVLIASLFMFCLGHTASAQMYGNTPNTSAGSGISASYGFRAGATFSTLNTETEEEVDLGYVTGLQLGAVANFYINPILSIQPEILYIQKGSKASYKVEESYPDFYYEEEGNLEMKTDYLEVPLLMKASFGAGNLNFFVTAGPTFGYWLSGTEKATVRVRFTDGVDEFEESETSEDDIEFDDEDNRVEVGASVGLGIGYRVGTGTLNLDVRYGLGLTDIYEIEDDSQAKNRVFGISLAYLFSM